MQFGQHVHLIGIGGAGLSAIARILLEKSHKVSGSDRTRNALTDALARDGATIYEGHDASYANGADCVIVTSAARPEHVEVAAARARNIPVYKRADIMAALMEGKRVIAVAGTHGKTTTTAMIVHILRECGKDPSYIVGGVMRNTGTNAGVGQGDLFVIEADEYDNMFHGLGGPYIAVVTNIEYDHPDFFKSVEELTASFEHFLNMVIEDGLLLACADDPLARELTTKRWGWAAQAAIVTYGLHHPEAHCRAANIAIDNDGFTNFEFRFQNDVGRVRLAVPGTHNIQNALAALFVAVYSEDIPFIDAARALASFQGTGRRFELRTEIEGVAVIDDYAHHPTAIKVTLEAARQRYPDRALWAVWQPHTYTRTQALIDEYAAAFDTADHVLITDIYAARENPIPGVSSAAVLAKMNHPDTRHIPTFDDTVTVLDKEVQAPAVILIMSAGDAPTIGIEFLKRRQERHANPAR